MTDFALVTFNAWIGQDATDDRDRNDLVENVHRMLNDAKEAIGLPISAASIQEVKDWRGTTPGYERLAADASERREATSTIILVKRRRHQITRRRHIHVDGPEWIGPKHGIIHPPRVFPGGTVELPDGLRVDLLGLHRTPGGPRSRNADSWKAEHVAIERWAARRERRHPDRPMVLWGDLNERPHGDERDHPFSTLNLAKELGAQVRAVGIDGDIYRNCRLMDIVELPKRYGSDAHNPVVSRFSTRR